MTSDMSAESLLVKAKATGSLTPEERKFAYQSLINRNESTEIHALLRSLSLTSPPATRFVDLAEQIWNERESDWAVQGAIYALCVDWGMTEEYLPKLITEISLVNWQHSPSAGIASASALATYVAANKNKRLVLDVLGTLAEVCEEERLGSELFWSTHLSCLWSIIEHAVDGTKAIYSATRVSTCSDIPKDTLAEAKKLASSEAL